MQSWWFGLTLAWLEIAALAIYATMVPLVFLMHTQMPVTLGLAVVRSVAWPLWVAFGWPHGTLTLPMD